MAQVVATRSIQSSFLCRSSGSVQDRGVEKLKSASFASKVLAREEKKRITLVRRSTQITAKRSAGVESEVVPVSPEDVPKVCAVWLLRKCGKIRVIVVFFH